MNHVRVFRRVEPSRVRFEVRSFSGRGGGVHDTPAQAARALKAGVLEHADRNLANVSVDFRPEYGMEWPMGEPFAYRCVPLNPAEQHAFWEAFIKEP